MNSSGAGSRTETMASPLDGTTSLSPNRRRIAFPPVRVDAGPGDPQFWEKVYEVRNPWCYGSAYEQEKYRRTLALLDGLTVGSALELACAEGHFTTMLGPRVGRLLATDISDTAVRRCAERCAHLSNVAFMSLNLADLAPLPQSDLIVCSEALYYLPDRASLDRVATKIHAGLAPGGLFLSTHAFVASDTPLRTGFNWQVPFGIGTIEAVISALPGLTVERSVETPLYKALLWRNGGTASSGSTQRKVTCKLPIADARRSIVWRHEAPGPG